MNDRVSKVIDYAKQLLLENDPKQNGEFTWDQERKERSWTYYTGCMMDAFLRIYRTDKAEYKAFYDWVDSFYNGLIVPDGEGYSLGDQYCLGELDSVACGHPLLSLLALEKEEGKEYNPKYLAIVDFIVSELSKHTTFPEKANNFIHKMNNKNWQYWSIALDGIYMSNPFILEQADLIEKENPEKATEIRTAAFNRIHWVAQNLKRENGIYTHAYSASTGELNNISWLRAIGWYAMALPKVIDEVKDEEQKKILVADLKEFFDGMMKFADEETGLWYNVVDETNVTLPGNYLETSGSAMVAYALMHAYNRGYADRCCYEAGVKAFNSLVDKKIVTKDNGKLSVLDIYKKSGVETTKEGYLKEDNSPDEAKGTAALIMAALEV